MMYVYAIDMFLKRVSNGATTASGVYNFVWRTVSVAEEPTRTLYRHIERMSMPCVDLLHMQKV